MIMILYKTTILHDVEISLKKGIFHPYFKFKSDTSKLVRSSLTYLIRKGYDLATTNVYFSL